jgi:tyrosyl-tRNA synthetase
MPKKDEIIKRLIANSAEIITEPEFNERISSNKKLTHYIGFEISGYVHIGQGIMSALIMKDLTDLGVQCTVWLADWHSAINEKLDGKKETAARIGQGYFTEAIKACFKAVGGDPEKLEFRLASEWYAHDPMRYWELVVKVMQHTTQARLQRSISIMGRKEGSEVDGAKLMYPAMQVADILYQGIDIAHAGMDQRKAHVVMRDVADKIVTDKPKPIALHHSLIMGLQLPVETDLRNTAVHAERNKMELTHDLKERIKMSKSDPDSAILIHDQEEVIERKVRKAFCPEKETQVNPILNWTKHLLFWNRTEPFKIERKPEHGGTKEFISYEELEKVYAEGELHPMDLKTAAARELTELLAPVREHCAQPEVAAKKAELDKVLSSR